MICYKDRSYCSASFSCSKKDCYRKLSVEEQRKAEELGLPIAFSDFGSSCVYREEEENDE